jgi:hypothetical protein
MTLPNTRHLDALVAKYVLRLEDVRLGWAFSSDAQPQWSSDRDYYGRDYIYRAREATETDAGYKRVPDYASDGNAMLRLLRLLERQQTYIEDANSFQSTTVKLYSLKLGIISRGTGDALPEAVGWASLDMLERHARWKGDQSFDVRRELQRLEDAYQEAINQKGVEHA